MENQEFAILLSEMANALINIGEYLRRVASKGIVIESNSAPRHKYANKVMMTETEYAKLVTDYGEDGVKRLVELLDNYKAASGRTYKSDYRAILNLVVDKYKSEQKSKNE